MGACSHVHWDVQSVKLQEKKKRQTVLHIIGLIFYSV